LMKLIPVQSDTLPRKQRGRFFISNGFFLLDV